ncbi:hypothetical protein [Paucibacter sp. DJ2R-2]|uniref:hypothetical protein n=1 Tax=Paucibacter sp. DJ2R-2 TaxID=2893558 RepID=UPI0021E4D656|nr:hypothetical protein [Paucibacter sp. DJ2R-2]MCV2438589.1 hypothetical protein [Paucibacter sp. DJ2R-2]
MSTSLPLCDLKQPHAASLALRGSLGFSMAKRAAGLLLAAITLTATPAFAVDGCLVLLCFAAPSWRAIPQCVPVIRQLLRDLARGRVFPHCGMAGAGNSGTHEWAQAPGNCPPQYVHYVERPNGVIPVCEFDGAVAVNLRSDFWSRTWWSLNGDSVTEFSPEAKRQLSTWDPRFDEDYARWLSMQPPPNECPGC